MKKLLALVFTFCFAFISFSSIVFAHPGGLDSNGGHTCYTNCYKWDLKFGQYHIHRAAETSPQESTVSETRDAIGNILGNDQTVDTIALDTEGNPITQEESPKNAWEYIIAFFAAIALFFKKKMKQLKDFETKNMTLLNGMYILLGIIFLVFGIFLIVQGLLLLGIVLIGHSIFLLPPTRTLLQQLRKKEMHPALSIMLCTTGIVFTIFAALLIF